MCRASGIVANMNEIRTFNKYLVFYDGTDDRFGLRGISSNAPPEAIDDFISWYRDNNRYENGRLRPESIVRKTMIIAN